LQQPGNGSGATPPACERCGQAHPADDTCPGPAGGRTLQFGAPQEGAGQPAAPPADPLIGARVGSFQIVRPIGRGGMGTVYLAEHPAIGSKVAIKFLHQSMAADPQLVARFYDEARAVNLIGHDNIVGVYDLSLLPPDRYYYVMEYLEGETLGALLRRGRVPSEIALDVLLQLCDALQCAHERGVVHRDLKPDNVFLVARRGRTHFVKLVDFGIAKLRGATGGRTQSGVIVGTPEYMAPEQCDDGPIDPRTDVYALGAMAFELFTGRLPFAGSVTQLLLAQLRTPPPRPSSLAPVPPALEAAILRAMEKEPGRRFQDMAAFARALRESAEERAASPAAPAPAPAAAPPPPPAPTPPAREPLSELLVELAAGPEGRRSLPAVELTRAGLYLRAEARLPPLFSRVKLSLSHPTLRGPLALEAEVVRHVLPAEAAAFRMAPGFALQLVDLPPEARAAVVALADAVSPRQAAPTAAPPGAEAAGARLAELEGRAGKDPYLLLGLAPDAEFAEVRRAARALREEIELLRAHPQHPAHPARATALLGRVEAAQAALGAPAPRLSLDARSGNWRGVRRSLAAGVPEALVAARREELLRAEPGRAAEAQRQLARAQVAGKLGNWEAAAAAWEAALAADPLDGKAMDGYLAFRRRRGAE